MVATAATLPPWGAERRPQEIDQSYTNIRAVLQVQVLERVRAYVNQFPIEKKRYAPAVPSRGCRSRG